VIGGSPDIGWRQPARPGQGAEVILTVRDPDRLKQAARTSARDALRWLPGPGWALARK
jgi:hypothetical protein